MTTYLTNEEIKEKYILCECGCGEEVTYKSNKFIHGHHMRLKKYQSTCFEKGSKPWNKDMKGIHLSPDSEWKKGNQPWNKDLIGNEYKQYYINGFGGLIKKGQNLSPETEFKKGNIPPWTGKCRPNFSGVNHPFFGLPSHKHPGWKGGLSFQKYCNLWYDYVFKQFIKERDGNKCLNPHCKKNSLKLCIHHINYNKKDCDQYNLITLCISCNSTANYNRDWHQSWYEAIIYRRYLGGAK